MKKSKGRVDSQNMFSPFKTREQCRNGEERCLFWTVVDIWNMLTKEMMEIETFTIFKRHLDRCLNGQDIERDITLLETNNMNRWSM